MNLFNLAVNAITAIVAKTGEQDSLAVQVVDYFRSIAAEIAEYMTTFTTDKTGEPALKDKREYFRVRFIDALLKEAKGLDGLSLKTEDGAWRNSKRAERKTKTLENYLSCIVAVALTGKIANMADSKVETLWADATEARKTLDKEYGIVRGKDKTADSAEPAKSEPVTLKTALPSNFVDLWNDDSWLGVWFRNTVTETCVYARDNAETIIGRMSAVDTTANEPEPETKALTTPKRNRKHATV